jgi:peroxiredoxin Q/BCP
LTLSVGAHAPDFALPSASGASISLSALLANGPVVLFFYPKDGTAGCTVEACAFRDRHDEFVGVGAQVVGVSSDSVVSHARFASKHDLPMILLSDEDGKVRTLYGVGPKLGLFPGRTTFVIDRDGVVRYVLESQLRWDAHSREALSVVKQLR